MQQPSADSSLDDSESLSSSEVEESNNLVEKEAAEELIPLVPAEVGNL